MNSPGSPRDILRLSVSIVVYRPNMPLLSETLSSLADACVQLKMAVPAVSVDLFVVDNGGLPDITSSLEKMREAGACCTVLSGHGNVGYGSGHNLAIERSASDYHLVLNPDIDIEPNALATALRFLEENLDVGLLSPCIKDEARQLQYLCRRYPTVLDLFVRALPSDGPRRLLAKRLARYEMRDRINERDIVWDPVIVSGCFMLFRTVVLKKVGGFDPRYFLYFEDYDLSLRAGRVARLVYAPAVRVVHHGGGAARKGSAHIRMFTVSAFKFFNRFGWK